MNRLITDYFDSTKDIFLHPTTTNILNDARRDGNLSQLTREDIIRFRQSLYDISRETEARILRGKKRYLASRKWISFAPGKTPPPPTPTSKGKLNTQNKILFYPLI